MATETYDFEDGTLGSTITTTTAPFDNGSDPSCDVTYGPGINGDLAMRIDYHATSGAQNYANRIMYLSGGAVATCYSRGTFTFTRYMPSNQCALMTYYETGSYREEVRFNTDGTISIYDYQATARDTSAVAFGLGDIFRLEWKRTATTQELRIFHGANLYGTTADEVLTGTSTGSDVNRIYFGSRISFGNSNPNYTCLDIDDIGYDTTTWLGAPTDAGTTGVQYLSKSAYQSSSDPASMGIPEPEGAAVGDVCIVLFAHKEASPTINTPSGWTLIATEEAGQGANGSSNGGTARAWAFGKVLDGTESWPVSFTTDIPGAGYATVIGQGYLFRSRTADAIGFTGSSGDDNTAGTAWSVTTGALTTEPHDAVIVVSAINDTTSATAEALAQTGATFGPVEELLEFALWGNNFKVTHITALAEVVTGAAATAITYTMTQPGTSGDSPAGPSVVTIVHLDTVDPQDITGSTSLDFGMGITAGDGELSYRDVGGPDEASLDFGMTTGSGGVFSAGEVFITGVTSLDFGSGTNPSGAVEASIANDSVLYRISPGNAPGPGKISEHPLWRRVDRIPTPYSIVVEDGVARRVRYPSNDLDPDTVYLGGHEYQILDTHEHYAALVAAGITMEEIG